MKKLTKISRIILVYIMVALVSGSSLASAYATYATIVIEHIWVDDNNSSGKRDEIVKDEIKVEVEGHKIKDDADVSDKKWNVNDDNKWEDDGSKVQISKPGEDSTPQDKDTLTDDGSAAGAAAAEGKQPEDGYVQGWVDGYKAHEKEEKAPVEPEIPIVQKPDEPIIPKEPEPPDWSEFDQNSDEYKNAKEDYDRKVDEYNEKLEDYKNRKDEYETAWIEYENAWNEYKQKLDEYNEQLKGLNDKNLEYKPGNDAGFNAGFQTAMGDSYSKYEEEYNKGFAEGSKAPIDSPELNEALDQAIKDALEQANNGNKYNDEDVKDALENEATEKQIDDIVDKAGEENKWSISQDYNTGVGNGKYDLADGVTQATDENGNPIYVDAEGNQVTKEEEKFDPVVYWATISEDSERALRDAGYTSVMMKVTIELESGKVYVSLDGGKNWTQSGEFDPTAAENYDPTKDYVTKTTFTFLHVLTPEDPPDPPKFEDKLDGFDFSYNPPEPEENEEHEENEENEENEEHEENETPEEPPVNVPEEPVPLEEPTVEEEELLEEDVPLANVPETGDFSSVWPMLTMIAVTGLVGATLLERKKEENS